MRFEEAIGEYERVYQLAYKDPKWMEKIAEIRARQGRAEDAVAALKTALIEGRPEKAENFFEAARRLESWGMLEQARGFAEQGVSSAGAELLSSTENHSGAKLYARILTRQRQQEKANAALQSALSGALSPLPVIKEQLAKEGIAGVTDSEWRRRQQEIRIENARKGMREALVEMGSAVARYFTPEEKVSFARFSQTLRAPMTASDAESFAIPMAESAGLAEVEAEWRYDIMMNSGESYPQLLSEMNAFTELQRRRLKFADLGPQLERFAPRLASNGRVTPLLAAAQAYRSAGDEENELRVLSSVGVQFMGAEVQKRFLSLLLARRPEQLVQLAAQWTPWGEQAADFAVANGDPALVHAVVAARGRIRPVVWSKAYNALTGLYFAEPAPEINQSFLAALGDNTIGERLGHPVDRNAQFAGTIWFYYGSRYGEYLGATKQGTPEDFLPALLEESPATASSYIALADYYAEAGDMRSAISDYNHALELGPDRADVHDRLAVAYFRQGARSEAVAQWKHALATLTRQVGSASVPESFWTDFASICDHLQTRRLFAQLKPDADALVRAYLRRNGNYRSNAPLRSVYLAMNDPAVATPWLLDLASAAPDPTRVLADVADASWIPLGQRAPILQRILENKQDALSRAEGLEKENALEELRNWQIHWVKYLIQTKQFGPAADYIGVLPAETRSVRAANLVPYELQAAAQLGTLDAKIAAYRADMASAPPSEVLRSSAHQLFEAGDKQLARKVIEFVFGREIDEHKLVASNFLGLAEIRIASGDVPGALELLRRLVIVVGKPYENLDPAAALLEKTGHNTEAVEFLDQLVKSAPWEPSYQLRLAKTRRAVAKDSNASADALAKIASETAVPYSVRVEAAVAFAGAHAPSDFGSVELKLLAGELRSISIPVADQPFSYDSRLRAGQNASDSVARLQILSKALADTPARNDARIAVFQAAVTLHSDEFALASIEQVLQQQVLRGASYAENEEEEDIVRARDSEVGGNDVSLAANTSLKLTPAQQAQISWEVANVMARLRRWKDAVPYLQTSLKVEKTPALHKEISARLAEVRSIMSRERLNQARQPILHQELEQDRVVRPRLAARPVSPAKIVARGGQ